MAIEWKQDIHGDGPEASVEALRTIAEQLDRLNGNMESIIEQSGVAGESKCYSLRVSVDGI